MKLNAIRTKKFFRGAYFTYILTGANNETKQYHFDSFVDFAGGINPGGMTIYVDEYLQVGAQFGSMIDRKGNLLFPSLQNDTGAVFEVNSCLPILDIYGNKNGYRAGLSRISGAA